MDITQIVSKLIPDPQEKDLEVPVRRLMDNLSEV